MARNVTVAVRTEGSGRKKRTKREAGATDKLLRDDEDERMLRMSETLSSCREGNGELFLFRKNKAEHHEG